MITSIAFTVLRCQKDGLPIIAALDHMMGKGGKRIHMVVSLPLRSELAAPHGKIYVRLDAAHHVFFGSICLVHSSIVVTG